MDLKPHNLLLHKGSDGKYTLKVADFGFAQYLCSERGGGVRGSPLYMAPEMLAGAYDARVDLWSVGVIMYECLFGKAPYSSNTFKELVDKIQNQEKIQIPPNSSISAGCRDLLSRLLKHDPDERISYEDFFNHEYLDLEHMPSKENYEKFPYLLSALNLAADRALCAAKPYRVDNAVCGTLQAVALMSRAVQLDGSARACSDAAARVGLLRGALELYRASLRHLVPSARAEPDAVRRGALSDKLTRYMERAEEIKEYLKCLERNVSPSLPPAGAAAGFGNTVPASTCSYTYGTVEEPACASYSRVSADRNGTVDITCRSNTGPDISAARVHSAQVTEPVDEKRRAMQAVEASGANDRPRTPPRFGIKRLFGKISALPTLTNSDSSLADDSSNKEKVDNQDGASEGCRIT
ncbi:unnamed protein product [Diatraea saccharalis]|uniref:non-specific serine/threonine protein kinase n=1 Tax=Diatraea saccharalis TaxID=40085 RepID=A0A9N9R5K5_9NEOP|nr:unnamed protein product [Diatraea saccharalis]